jgi:hypothetical protein
MVLCAGSALAQQQAVDQQPANQAAPSKQIVTQTVDVVAREPKDIPQGSAEATAKLVLHSRSARIGEPMDVGFKLTNNSRRTIGYLEPLVFLDLRDRKGHLAPETELGCLAHPLSPCQAKAGLRKPRRIPKWSVLPPHAEENSTLPLSGFYDVKTPGSYWLTGYVCGLKLGPEFVANAGPECFKTKRVKLKLQPAIARLSASPKE